VTHPGISASVTWLAGLFFAVRSSVVRVRHSLREASVMRAATSCSAFMANPGGSKGITVALLWAAWS
jgi:hypothetical protein